MQNYRVSIAFAHRTVKEPNRGKHFPDWSCRAEWSLVTAFPWVSCGTSGSPFRQSQRAPLEPLGVRSTVIVIQIKPRCAEDEEPRENWLRGRDLNPRPLGYESGCKGSLARPVDANRSQTYASGSSRRPGDIERDDETIQPLPDGTRWDHQDQRRRSSPNLKTVSGSRNRFEDSGAVCPVRSAKPARSELPHCAGESYRPVREGENRKRIANLGIPIGGAPGPKTNCCERPARSGGIASSSG